jgi:hypothetical protein
MQPSRPWKNRPDGPNDSRDWTQPFRDTDALPIRRVTSRLLRRVHQLAAKAQGQRNLATAPETDTGGRPIRGFLPPERQLTFEARRSRALWLFSAPIQCPRCTVPMSATDSRISLRSCCARLRIRAHRQAQPRRRPALPATRTAARPLIGGPGPRPMIHVVATDASAPSAPRPSRSRWMTGPCGSSCWSSTEDAVEEVDRDTRNSVSTAPRPRRSSPR